MKPLSINVLPSLPPSFLNGCRGGAQYYNGLGCQWLDATRLNSQINNNRNLPKNYCLCVTVNATPENILTREDSYDNNTDCVAVNIDTVEWDRPRHGGRVSGGGSDGAGGQCTEWRPPRN